MEHFRPLLKVLESLQSEAKRGDLARHILECLASLTEASRGFIVHKSENSYDLAHQIRFQSRSVTSDRRKFSRSLVREAIRSREIILSRDVKKDDRFSAIDSLEGMPHCSVIVAPLGHEGDVFAAIYLERLEEDGPFGETALAFTREFVGVVGHAFSRSLRLEELERFRRRHANDFLANFDFRGFVGKSPVMLRLLKTVANAAQSEAPVLVRGETGTGKELIAHALFANSPRKNQPFVTIHCGALPETLFEAELFGHTRGAFTGANRDRPGRISQADGGTLFIDEVAEIPLPSQAKLLRFFQFGDFQRLGSDRVEHVDVRVIAATHRDLKQMIREGYFREDLYYRLNVLELEVPPLREREGDLELLIQHFWNRFRGASAPRLSPEVVGALLDYDYPGNVRELAHALERMSVLSGDESPGVAHLPEPIRSSHHGRTSSVSASFRDFSNKELKRARNQAVANAAAGVERLFLNGLLEETEGKVSQAAMRSGINRTYLYRLLAKHGIKAGD